MTLRKQTLGIVGATLVGLIVILYVLSRTTLLGSFVKLEEQDMYQNVERARAALLDELDSLNSTAGDWAPWDDTYAFIEDANEDYVTANLVDSIFTTLRLNLMLFINSSGQTVFGKAFDLQNKTEIPVPTGLQQYLAADSRLLRHADPESSVTGIILLPEGPMLVAARPIVTSDFQGPIRGTLIMGLYLDSLEIERLNKITRLSFTVRRLDDPELPADWQAAPLSAAEPILVRPLDEQTIAGYVLLRDIDEKPSLALKVEKPREIYQRGQSSILYFMFGLLAVGLVFGGVTLWLLERRVLSRLTRIVQTISDIRVSGDLSARMAVTGQDELSSLAGGINGMLAAMQESKVQLEERGHDLAHHARYLEATAEVAQQATSMLSLPQLLSRSVVLINKLFGFYHTAIFLSAPGGERAVLKASSDESGRQRLEHGLEVEAEEGSSVDYVVRWGEPRIAMNASVDVTHLNPAMTEAHSETALPLLARGKTIGALVVQSREPQAFTQEDLAVLQTLADLVAMAISNAQLFEQAQESLVAERRAYGERSRQAWNEMMRASPYPGYYYDKKGVSPMDAEARSPGPAGDGQLPELALPIQLRGRVVGTIKAHKPGEAGEWTADEVALVKTLVEQLGVALEGAQLYQSTQLFATREQTLNIVTARIRAGLTLEQVLNATVQEVSRALGAPRVAVWLEPIIDEPGVAESKSRAE